MTKKTYRRYKTKKLRAALNKTLDFVTRIGNKIHRWHYGDGIIQHEFKEKTKKNYEEF